MKTLWTSNGKGTGISSVRFIGQLSTIQVQNSQVPESEPIHDNIQLPGRASRDRLGEWVSPVQVVCDEELRHQALQQAESWQDSFVEEIQQEVRSTILWRFRGHSRQRYSTNLRQQRCGNRRWRRWTWSKMGRWRWWHYHMIWIQEENTIERKGRKRQES